MPDAEFFHKEYDPIKAHNYYMENRKLKGKDVKLKELPKRKIGSGKTSGSSGKRVATKAQMATKTPKQMRAEADARVASIRTRLGKLTAHLDQLMKAAVEHDDAKKSKAKASSTPQKRGDSKLSGADAQKKKAADKKYYEEHKKPAAKTDASKPSEKDHQAEIDRVKAQIRTVRAQLKAAIQKARQASNSTKTAVQGR